MARWETDAVKSDADAVPFDGIKHRKKRAFLRAFCISGTVTHAALSAKIERTMHYHWLKTDAAYADAFAHAEGMAADSLEAEAVSRARDGWQEPVYQQGRLIGTVLKKSDTLLIFLLKGARPEKFRERHEVTGPNGGALQIQVVTNVPQPETWEG